MNNILILKMLHQVQALVHLSLKIVIQLEEINQRKKRERIVAKFGNKE